MVVFMGWSQFQFAGGVFYSGEKIFIVLLSSPIRVK